MPEITLLLLSLQPLLSTTLFRQLTLISEALLMMQGRVTMLGISRWTRQGGSYRTLQRFFQTRIDWPVLNWALIKPLLKPCKGVILIAGDATTVTKSGKATAGLGRFFSSIYSRVVPSIAFQTLSLIDVEKRRSWPMLVEQIAPKTPQQKPVTPQKCASKKSAKRPPGRPKGSKNKNQCDVVLNAEMTQVKTMLIQLLALLKGTLSPVYFVYDGAFGNNAAVQMTHSVGLHLISKLRNNSALYFEWSGEYAGRGRYPKYGQRINYQDLPQAHLKSDTTERSVRTRQYQFTAVHKKFADKLNIVIIDKENTKTGKSSHIILFSTDLVLEWEALVQYHRLRFQIEFNFRDAKQHWGLEDFMVTKEQAVLNAANLSLFMVNISQALLPPSGEQSILDLKARCHGIRYAQELFKILPKSADVINIEDWVSKIPILGRIHTTRVAA